VFKLWWMNLGGSLSWKGRRDMETVEQGESEALGGVESVSTDWAGGYVLIAIRREVVDRGLREDCR
jgi:hypothetical protein